jgi:hypothetical protein
MTAALYAVNIATLLYGYHNNLQVIMKTPNLNGRQYRWCIYFAPFDFMIKYKKESETGLNHLHAAVVTWMIHSRHDSLSNSGKKIAGVRTEIRDQYPTIQIGQRLDTRLSLERAVFIQAVTRIQT